MEQTEKGVCLRFVSDKAHIAAVGTADFDFYSSVECTTHTCRAQLTTI